MGEFSARPVTILAPGKWGMNVLYSRPNNGAGVLCVRADRTAPWPSEIFSNLNCSPWTTRRHPTMYVV